MLFLFIDQYNHNQPPISSGEPTCESMYSIDTWGLRRLLFWANPQRKEKRELATIEQLKERIKTLEERILVQEEKLKKTLDFIQRAIDTQLR